MQTHRDDDFKNPELYPSIDDEKKRDALQALADRMSREGTNQITAGAPGEKSISEKKHHGMTVTRMPDDPLCLRVSLGRADSINESAYLVYRGDPKEIAALLRVALAAIG